MQQQSWTACKAASCVIPREKQSKADFQLKACLAGNPHAVEGRLQANVILLDA